MPSPEAEREILRRVLLELAAERGPAATFCPSEAARRLGGDWRGRMAAVRSVAATLVTEGELACTRRGLAADPRHARGPIRLGMPGSPSEATRGASPR